MQNPTTPFPWKSWSKNFDYRLKDLNSIDLLNLAAMFLGLFTNLESISIETAARPLSP